MAADLDTALERTRLADALVSGMGELEDAFDAATLLQSFADLLVRVTPHFRLAWFYLGEPRAARLRPQYCAGPERAYGESLVVDRSALMMRGPVRQALEGGAPVVQPIPRELGPVAWLVPGVRRWHRAALQAGVRSVLALPFPLIDRDDWGLTVVYADHHDYFDATGLEPFRALARLVQVGLDRIALRAAERRTRADLDRARLEDPLTGLPNHAGFEAQWASLPESAAGGRLLMHLDIDHFAALNAGLGEAGGDAVLHAVAARLREFAGEGAVVARVGGDDFLVGTPIEDADDAEAAVERCQALVARPLPLDGRDHELSVTVGYALGDDRQPPTPRQAALALRHARREGAGARRAYGGDLEGGDTPQGLFGAVRAALEHGELVLWYQPQIALADPDRVTGAEALLRWQRGDGEMVPPGAFIPAVEGSAMIRDIGRWVLGETAAALQREGDSGPPVIGVNVGARHLLHPRFLEDVDAVLSRVPTAAARLSVEITETAAFTDTEATMAVVRALRRRGLGVALDDFGTGHASFTHLAELPVDHLKIDRRFVAGIDHRPSRLVLVESLLVAADGLGLGVIAEGVETAAEGEVLADLGCRVAQGFRYARPMPRDVLVDWLAQRRIAGDPGVPRSQPLLAAVARLTALLRAAERGDEPALAPALPYWFRALLADEAAFAEALAPVDAYLLRCRDAGRQPPAGDPGRAEALGGLARLQSLLRYRVNATRSDSRAVMASAGAGRK